MPRRRQVLIVTIAILLMILLVAIDRLFTGHFEQSRLIAISVVTIFLILLAVSQSFRRGLLRALNLVGEDRDSIRTRPAWHFLLVPYILFILCFYILLGDSKVTVPPVLQFNIIIVSSALGGLVLAAAMSQRASDNAHRELLSVAQKLIVATILFVFSAALLFIVELSGGINPNSFELTTLGWLRGICFWLTAICFFPGATLFSVGIIDLVLALTHVRIHNTWGSQRYKMDEIECLACGKTIKIPQYINTDNYDGQIVCQECKSLLHVKLVKEKVEKYKVVESKFKDPNSLTWLDIVKMAEEAEKQQEKEE